MPDINTTLNACELVWKQQSIAASTIAEMRTELESHLREASAEGKTIDSVVGEDINAFARSWANVQPDRTLPSISDIQETRRDEAERTRNRLMASLGAMAIVTIVGVIAGPRGDSADIEAWQWGFLGATVALLIGELLTGGFFILPFAIGGATASVLALADVQPAVQLLVFVVVSTLGLWGLREFASKDDDVVVPVGANRYVGQVAVVTEPISGVGTVGRVRLETENWMAITDNNEHIPAGAVVTVSAVRGARLVVHAG